MVEWSYFIPHAIGTFVGAIAAYIAVRVDIANLNGRLNSLDRHIVIVETSVKSAHDRIDRLVQAVHK